MFEKEYIYLLIDPKQPGFIKIGYGKPLQGENTEDSIIGYQVGMEVAFAKVVKMAHSLANKITNELNKKALGVNIKNDMFLISVEKCIAIINNIHGKFSEETINLKFLPNESINLVKLCEERSRIKTWERIGEFQNNKIFITRQFEFNNMQCFTRWVMMSYDIKAKKPRTFKSRKFGSEISKIKYHLHDSKYEYMYYSVFEKSMGAGELVFEDIIFPGIKLDIAGEGAGHNKLVIDYLLNKIVNANDHL
jgi:hypothetical protein